MMLLRKDTVTVVKSSFKFFSEQSGDFLNIFRPRGFQIAQVLVRGMAVNIMNVHTNALSDTASALDAAPSTSPQRQKQMHQVFSEVRSMPSCRAALVMGDLNTTPDLGEIPNDQYGFQDSWCSSQGPCITWSTENPLTGEFQVTEKDQRLDYIFMHGRKKPMAVSDVVFNQAPWVSDHFGIRSVILAD
jgi:endonuclease/exonuclease/phosphatase family metal-dependent hydrolase